MTERRIAQLDMDARQAVGIYVEEKHLAQVPMLLRSKRAGQ